MIVLKRTVTALASVLDRLFSVPISHGATVDIYARRLTLCEESGTRIRYIGTPARYNSARLLSRAVLYLIPVVIFTVGFVHYHGAGQSIPALFALWFATLSSAAAVIVLLQHRQENLRRVFAVTDALLISESPSDGYYVSLRHIDALLLQPHPDRTVTVTVVNRYHHPRRGRTYERLRRMDHHQASRLAREVRDASGGSARIYPLGSLRTPEDTLPAGSRPQHEDDPT